MTNTQKNVWITRTRPWAIQTARRIEGMGHKACIAPLLTIGPPNRLPKCPEKNSILVFTSKNGIDAFCKLFKSRDYQIITVGAASAHHAVENGFIDVIQAEGTARSIPKIVEQNFSKSQPIIHCAGRHVRGDIVGILNQHGYCARRDLYYFSYPVKKMPEIDLKPVTDILLYSPLAAQTLGSLRLDIGHVTLISISKNTDAALGVLKAKSRYIASAPTEDAVLTCLSA